MDSMVNHLFFVQIVSTPRSDNLNTLFRLFEYRYRDYLFQSKGLSEQLEKTILINQIRQKSTIFVKK